MAQVKGEESVSIGYPGRNFWNGVDKLIKIINERDFRKASLLGKLGLSNLSLSRTFGITEKKEIQLRQRVLRFLMENGVFAKFLQNLKVESIKLPTGGQEFLNYFTDAAAHNPFWAAAEKLVNILSGLSNVPRELQDVVTFLSTNREKMEAAERKMAEGISQEILKAGFLEGTLEVRVRNTDGSNAFSLLNSNTSGYKLYSFSVAAKWAQFNIRQKWSSWRCGWLVDLLALILDFLRSNLLFSALSISKTPWCVVEDVETFVKERVWTGDIWKDVEIPEYKNGDSVSLKLGYRYDDKGLYLQLLNVTTDGKDVSEKSIVKEGLGVDFPGYSQRQKNSIIAKRLDVAREKERIRREVYSYGLLTAIKNATPAFFDSHLHTQSLKTDKEFKWFAVSHLYEHDPRFHQTYLRAREVRRCVIEHVQQLKQIMEIGDAIKTRSKQWGLPYVFPEILDDDTHLVAFSDLMPIHLINLPKEGEKETSERIVHPSELMALNQLPAVSGRMIGFTGQNAGGKTTGMESIMAAIFMAQSGLPVFASSFSLNVKRVMGAVYVERGNGSMTQLMMEKHVEVLKALEGCDGKSTILFLDEVGSGTQEESGLDYGRKILRRLSAAGCSVIFCTQITQLAEIAVRDMDAMCFKYDKEHKLRPGIGKGCIENLMSQTGIDALLEVPTA